MAIELPPTTRKSLIESLDMYLRERMDTEQGNVQIDIFLDFLLQELGPVIYNKAVSDVQAILQDRVGEVDAVCFEDEVSFWELERQKRNARRSNS